MAKSSIINKLKTAGSAHTADSLGTKNLDKSELKNVYLALLFIISLAILIFGLVIVYSAVQSNEEYSFTRQIIGVAIGIALMLVFCKFDYKYLAEAVVPLIIINVVLILSPHIPGLGVAAKGAQSWIRVGIQIQPGEFAKITVILLAASVVARYGGHLDNPYEYTKTVFILLIPFLCIMTQPDLGTGLVYLFIAAVALVAGGARLKYLLITLAIFVLLFLMLLWADEIFKTVNENGEAEYHFLKNYQRQRLFVFLDPDNDTSDSGYNLKQAQIAIGSGGFFGKGLLNGTQAALKFLPEAPTDFIFCVLAEELGFIGIVFLLVLYTALIVISLKIAKACDDLFGKLIVVCCVGMWVFQIFENIGMTCGVMPITGIPLPFISFGSSFMIVNCVMIGFIGSVALNGIANTRRRLNYGTSNRSWKN